MIRVKICGLNDEAGVAAAVAGRADWIGFVFFPPSPRAILPARAASLSATAPSRRDGGPARVGLFVRPTMDDIARALDEVPLDALQLYDVHDIAAIRDRFGVRVWRALGVATTANLPQTDGGADALLIESRPPPGATRPGGNAVPLDWTMFAGWRAPCPWLLAGGLTPATVARAIAASGAEAVDVSSGIETSPGRKDPALIAAFILAARGEGHSDVGITLGDAARAE
jgi:phosphoribosylanthranilate isomerase